MTAVVAYTNGRTIWMAGDGFVGDDNKKDISKSSKVYQIGNLGVGLCGHVRQELILESVLRSSDPKDFTEDWLKFSFPDLLLETMKSKHAIVDDNGQASFGESHYILGLNGKLFYLENDFGIWEVKKNIAAIGAGREYTLGALSAMPQSLQQYPERTLVKSLKIAAEWSPWVTAPYTTIKVR